MKKKTLATLLIASVLTVGAFTTATAAYRANNHRGQNASCTAPSIQRQRGFEVVDKILTEKFNITEDEIKEFRDSSKTFPEFLEEKKVDTKVLAEEFKKARLSEVDTALENGDITADEATEMKEHIEEYVDESHFTNHMNRPHRNGKGNGRGHNQRKGRWNRHRNNQNNGNS